MQTKFLRYGSGTLRRVDERPRMRAFCVACLAVAFAAIFCTTASAQLAGKGAITGTVTDTTGAVIPGAQVTATNIANNIATTATTSETGSYTFSVLDPGIYTVTVTASGFKKLVQQNIHVNALESQTYNPVLAVGAADVQVTVSAEPPQLETSNATLGATMEQQTYAELPIEMNAYGQADQRRATDFVFLMPGVQGNNTNGNATTNTGIVNGSGSRGAVSDVYIDGIPFVRAAGNGDPRYVWTAISVDAVDQFQVQTTGYSAIYEGQGVMNYSVKHGGSNFHGTAYEFFRNTALDSWGFFKAFAPGSTTTLAKPVEHSNEYGINLSGALIPFGGLKQKLFFFTNYNGFRYGAGTPTPMRFPTNAERTGDFSADGVPIYDPLSQAQCTANSTDGPCRYRYGYPYSGTPGPRGGPVTTPPDPTKVDVIPQSEFSSVAKNLQAALPSIPSTALGNNYTAANFQGLINWSTTSRIDYVINSRDTVSLLVAIGRQASAVPAGQTSSGRNVGPVPYNYGQAYAPKTKVFTLEETHVFSSNLINQLKYGYAYYSSKTINPGDAPNYSATKMGLTNTPPGQATTAFPTVQFAGTQAPTNWNGQNEGTATALNYTLVDDLQWNHGRHSFTFGGQIAWLLYNNLQAKGGTTPITLATAVTETAGINKSSNSSPAYVATSGTGLSYASFLVGEIDKGSFTQYLQSELGTRFRAISPYVQDDWKVTPKLTLNLGLRYDFFPTLTEVHNAQSFFNPTLANPVTGINGALAFTGSGSGTINAATPINNYYKNWGPRLGLAYQLGSKTVVRASYGVMFTHGDAVGGGETSLGTLGFSAAPSFSANGQLLTTFDLTGTNSTVPSFTPASGVSSGAAYGTGYYGNSGSYSGSPQSGANYYDPYYGGRAPEYLNWSFGVQRQLMNVMTVDVSYVGSEGHFLRLDSFNARGYWSNQLDPKYLALGTTLGVSGTGIATACAANGLPCPANFNTKQTLSAALKPFPFHSVGDTFGYVGNANYNALQAVLSTHAWHGLTNTVSYVQSRSIDDGGTFRTGWPILAGTLANHPTSTYKADRIERSVSTSNQPQHFVATAVWDMPFGRSIASQSAVERAVLGGYKVSGVFQAYSGSPLALTESSNQTNPAESTHVPIVNPNFTGQVRVNGKWGHGTSGDPRYKAAPSYIAPSTGTSASSAQGPFMNPVTGVLSSYAYMFGDAPRTAPYNLYGPGNYGLDLSLARTFPLHITEAATLNFRAEWYNVTNHTFFALASTAVGNGSFGQVTNNGFANRKSAQFSARINF
ncbi:MAG TPA: TonB-dependent receptor [Terracidiphilus sp.]|nr:TonB-dependent receptor [Terracidiphilus sp.]